MCRSPKDLRDGEGESLIMIRNKTINRKVRLYETKGRSDLSETPVLYADWTNIYVTGYSKGRENPKVCIKTTPKIGTDRPLVLKSRLPLVTVYKTTVDIRIVGDSGVIEKSPS